MKDTGPMPTPRILLEDSYATYPHSNGYYDDGRRVAVGMTDGAEEIRGVSWKGAEDVEVLLAAAVLADAGVRSAPWTLQEPQRSVPWFDISLRSQTLVCARGEALFAVELVGASRDPRVAYRPRDGWMLDGLASVSADGRSAVVGESRDGTYRALLVDLHDGAATEVVTHPWHANHFHFVPADESWIGYSHEGPATTVDDRLWARHAQHAPQGRAVVDQRALSDVRGGSVALGHERWMFHDVGAVVIAYGESPVGPRGVYEVFADGRPPRLVSPGDRDWHCGVTRDGTRIVVDTTGLADAPGRGWTDAGTASSIVVIDSASGARTEIARTGFIAHPYHPHPSFTPDGSAVVFTHVERDREGAVVRRGAAVLDLADPGAFATRRELG